MSMIKKIMASAVAIIGLGISVPSNAVTVVNFDGAAFSVNAVGSGATYTFTYRADFTGITGASSWWNGYAAGVSLDFGNNQLSSGSGLANTTAGGSWTYFQDKINANGCADATGSAICAAETGKVAKGNPGFALSLLNGNVLTWTFNVSFVDAATATTFFSGAHNLKFLATTGGIDTNDGSWTKQGDLVSKDIEITCCKRPPDELPEPGTLALLGLGLMGLGFSRRRTAV